MVVDQSIQEFFDKLGLDKHLDMMNEELVKLNALIGKEPDPLLIKKIQAIEDRRDKCFKMLRSLRREVDPSSIISNTNPGYH